MTLRSSKAKKSPAKTAKQRKPGITTKSKPKPTQHILWRGKQITEFGETTHTSFLVGIVLKA